MSKRAVNVVEGLTWVPFAVLILPVVGLQVSKFKDDFGKWDFLLLSGLATLAVGLAFAETIPGRLERTLHRLRDCGTLDATDEHLSHLAGTLQQRSRVWGLIGAVVDAAAILAAFLVVGRTINEPLLWLEVFGGLFAGYELGRMSSYGSLGSLLKRDSCTIKVRPDHFDNAGGLKPIGDYYFVQATIAGIPAAFLAAWWLLIPVVPRNYQSWRNPYLGLLALAIGFELLCFFLPIWYFHREMERQKAEYLGEADRISSHMALFPPAAATAGAEEAKVAKARVAEARERYQLIDEMPTWPVDPKTRHRFRTRNLLLLLPLAGQFVSESSPWKAIAAALSRVGG